MLCVDVVKERSCCLRIGGWHVPAAQTWAHRRFCDPVLSRSSLCSVAVMQCICLASRLGYLVSLWGPEQALGVHEGLPAGLV